jgi:branched-chain amino acid transport system substrate-binding protein
MERRLFIATLTSLALTAPFTRAGAQSLAGVKVGVHLDQAKQASYYSLIQKEAIDLFVQERNKAGGVLGAPVEVLYEDDENDPVTTVTKVDKFAAAGVSAIVSIGSSATGLAAQQRAEELHIPIGSPANLAEQLTTEPPKRYYFRIPLRGKYEVQAIAQYLRLGLKASKIAIVRDGTQTGLVISDQWIKDLTAAGFTIAAVEQITPGSTEATGQAMRVKNAGADAVIVAGASIPDLANYIKTQKLIGNKAPLIGSSLFTAGGFLKLVGPAGEGFVYPDAIDPSRPEVRSIEAKLISAAGDKMRNQAVGVQAWEFMRLLVDAVNRAGTPDREKLRDSLEATQGFAIALGPPVTKLGFSPSNHDLFTSADQVVLRSIVKGEYGPGLKFR